MSLKQPRTLLFGEKLTRVRMKEEADELLRALDFKSKKYSPYGNSIPTNQNFTVETGTQNDEEPTKNLSKEKKNRKSNQNLAFDLDNDDDQARKINLPDKNNQSEEKGRTKKKSYQVRQNLTSESEDEQFDRILFPQMGIPKNTVKHEDKITKKKKRIIRKVSHHLISDTESEFEDHPEKEKELSLKKKKKSKKSLQSLLDSQNSSETQGQYPSKFSELKTGKSEGQAKFNPADIVTSSPPKENERKETSGKTRRKKVPGESSKNGKDILPGIFHLEGQRSKSKSKKKKIQQQHEIGSSSKVATHFRSLSPSFYAKLHKGLIDPKTKVPGEKDSKSEADNNFGKKKQATIFKTQETPRERSKSKSPNRKSRSSNQMTFRQACESLSLSASAFPELLNLNDPVSRILGKETAEKLMEDLKEKCLPGQEEKLGKGPEIDTSSPKLKRKKSKKFAGHVSFKSEVGYFPVKS